MGNNSNQPQIPTKPTQSPPSPIKITKPKTFKQEIVQQPKIEVIFKVPPKVFNLQYQLTQQQQNYIAEMKGKIKQQFKLRFMSKIHKKQIRLVFSNSQHQESKEMLVSLTGLQDKSLQKLQRSCRMDLEIYLQIFQMRLKEIISRKLSQENNHNLQDLQKLKRIKSELTNLFREGMVTLLGQIQGKTTIWHSLSLTITQITTNIINFCHQQGIDSSIFDFLTQKNSIMK